MLRWCLIVNGLVFHWRIVTEYARLQKRDRYAETGNKLNGKSFVNIEWRERQGDQSLYNGQLRWTYKLDHRSTQGQWSHAEATNWIEER